MEPNNNIVSDLSRVTTKASLPPELENKFNWGAFFLNWVWGAFHGYYWPLLIAFLIILGSQVIATIIVAIMTIGFKVDTFDSVFFATLIAMIPVTIYYIWLGKKGNKIAWERKWWRDVEHFKSTQKKWAITGVVLASIVIILSTIIFTFLILVGKSVDVQENAGETLVVSGTTLTEKEKGLLIAEYANYRSVVGSGDGEAIIDYLVASAEPLFGREGFAENAKEYREWNNPIFIENKQHLTEDWANMMPEVGTFASVLNDSVVEKYDTNLGDGVQIVDIETPRLPGKDFAWVMNIIIIPDENKVVFVLFD